MTDDDEIAALEKLVNVDNTKTWSHEKDWDIFSQHWYFHTDEETEYPYELETAVPSGLWGPAQLEPTLGKILVTQGYANLYHRIKLGFSLGTKERSTVAKRSVMVTGQPGTGKSVSLWYLATRLLQEFRDEPLVVVYGKPEGLALD
ncbi:hypothetical protein D9757_015340 [Collybiopsis confluens]|uniref:Uncharacterized protein n=1 Tax=Collybiopsis confluens TaxID=2823264 RepID=A0A8H5CMC7_9AGAR|nr:hypothetical protein D9757_015340 [Collybiopsis confluens]